jgi:hypothetical protein
MLTAFRLFNSLSLSLHDVALRTFLLLSDGDQLLDMWCSAANFVAVVYFSLNHAIITTVVKLLDHGAHLHGSDDRNQMDFSRDLRIESVCSAISCFEVHRKFRCDAERKKEKRIKSSCDRGQVRDLLGMFSVDM